MMRLITLWRNRAGSAAAEFGMLLPLLSMLLIGTIDAGRYLWACNRAEKATQMGVRFAVVTDLIPGGLSSYDFVGVNGLTQGQTISSSTAFKGATCATSSATDATSAVACTCDTGTASDCPWLGTASSTAFTNILTRMQLFYPEMAANNLVVQYEFSGLGFAGDPNGTDVAPVVVVKLRNATFKPILFTFFGSSSLALPAFQASLTLEDGAGTVSN